MPATTSPGLHHVTAIASDAQRNVDFYTGTLGLRLVKRTINFDDPGTYHLYYGDATGRPGTILTFFPFAAARQGRAGTGESTETAFAVPPGTLDAWAGRLPKADAPTERFGERVLTLRDPDGLPLALVETDDVEALEGWSGGSVPAAIAPRGFYASTLEVPRADQVVRLLTDVFGYQPAGEEDGRQRLVASGGGALGNYLDLVEGDERSRPGAGTVHHVAFRTESDEQQAELAAALHDLGIGVTEVKDRNYFRSVYFRDRAWTGGVLFEIATDAPGFLIDEDEAALGRDLKLPAWFEPHRERLEASLPALTV